MQVLMFILFFAMRSIIFFGPRSNFFLSINFAPPASLWELANHESLSLTLLSEFKKATSNPDLACFLFTIKLPRRPFLNNFSHTCST